MQVQPLCLEHLDAIVRFNVLCFPHDPWPEDDWKMLLEDARSVYYALMEGNQILGCVFIYNWQGERAYIKIMDLAVHPDHRNRGYAHMLLEHIAAEMTAIGMYQFRGETRQTNKPMQRVFEDCGYHLDSVEADYYENPTENAYKYLLQL